jgi:hypothetical protein
MVVAGSQITLTASPASGSVFTGWSGGGCYGTGTCVVTVSAAATVTATFAAGKALQVSVTGPGSGTVSGGGGISCPGTCSVLVASGSQVTLTASPDPGSYFAGWQGGGCSGTGDCNVTVSTSTTVTATFGLTATLHVSLAGSGVGLVSGGAGIQCPGTCSASVPTGTQITLYPAPYSGSAFAGWSGVCSGAGACSVWVFGDMWATATFERPPVNSLLPTISGRAVQDEVLSEEHGAWTGSPTSFRYQWQRCDGAGAGCGAIDGATGVSYTPTASDVGHTIRVVESAINAAGTGGPVSSAATSMIVAPAPSNLSPPMISGSLIIGQTLTVTRGSWSNNPTTYTYQWQRCDAAGNGCFPIPGATADSYTLGFGGDIARTFRVVESASNAAGTGVAVSSATALSRVPLIAPPANSIPPGISGAAIVGHALVASAGAWSGTGPFIYRYQWQRCRPGCSNILGATSSSYLLTATDIGATIRVLVAATSGAGYAQAASGQIGPIVEAGPSPDLITAALSRAIVPTGKAARIAAILSAGGYPISFNAPGEGRLAISWQRLTGAHSKPDLVASTTVVFHRAGAAKIKITLTRRGRVILKGAKRLKLTAKGSYTLVGRSAVLVTRQFVIAR